LVAVTINVAPTAPTASSQTFCNSATVANLVATGTSLRWYTIAIGGTALTSTTALTTGNYFVSQTVNTIESPRATVSITVNTTAAPTATSQTFNNSATVANLIATGTSLQWYTVASGGTALAPTTTLVSGNYYVSQIVNTCESPRTLVAVNINVAPTAPTASSQTFCNSATVANLVATGTSLKWYAVATGGTALASTTALSTGNYFVSQTVNTVESPRTTVLVTLYSTPIARSITSPTPSGRPRAPICIRDAKILNILSGYSATTIQWESAVTALNSNIAPASSTYTPILGATGPSYTVINAAPGRNYFRVKFTNGNCNNTVVYSNPFIVFYRDCSIVNKLTSVISYPNPFTDNFNLSLITSSEEKVTLSIYDMTGKLIEQRESNSNDVSKLKIGDFYPSGIYNVIVSQGSELKTVRVIKR